MSSEPKLLLNIDYTINADGNLVFTREYLLKRGYCCQSGCLNCPYGWNEKIDPNVPAEFRDAWETIEEEDDDDF